MSAILQETILSRYAEDLLREAKMNQPCVTFLNFLKVFFKYEKHGLSKIIPGLDIGKYLTRIESLEFKEDDQPEITSLEKIPVHKVVADLLEKAHHAGIILFQPSYPKDVPSLSLIDPMTVYKGLCWLLDPAKQILRDISYEFERVDYAFRQKCTHFVELNNADVAFENTAAFAQLINHEDWPKLLAYKKLMKITDQTVRQLLKNKFVTKHGPLTVKRALTGINLYNPEEILAFKEFFNLSDGEIQPHLSL